MEAGLLLSARHQRITSGFSAKWTQTGSDVTAESFSWNKVLKPGQSIYMGFDALQTEGDPAPTAFTLNGTTCS
ncbi:cellulose binding domain-containing protein [Microbispora sp. CA-135349]|uniref:cellulose binding domain-containing protein n=1 Tax=Microbispora sp. CA-135349 TaxID=3239953 RepID=UPI003D8DFD03